MQIIDWTISLSFINVFLKLLKSVYNAKYLAFNTHCKDIILQISALSIMYIGFFSVPLSNTPVLGHFSTTLKTVYLICDSIHVILWLYLTQNIRVLIRLLRAGIQILIDIKWHVLKKTRKGKTELWGRKPLKRSDKTTE